MIQHDYYEQLGLKIDEKSFRECWIDPEKAIGKDILQVYPDLKKWVEFVDHPKKYPTVEYKNTGIIKFIIAMYDPKSPFKHLGYIERKNCAAIYAGFKTNIKGDFSALAQDIMEGRVEVIVKMILRYCIITRGLDWASYHEYERRFYDYSLGDPDKKIPDLEKEKIIIEKYRDFFLAGDKTIALQEAVYRISVENELKQRLNGLRPEYQEQFFYNKIAMSREQIEKSYEQGEDS